jgi:hypothetical protein
MTVGREGAALWPSHHSRYSRSYPLVPPLIDNCLIATQSSNELQYYYIGKSYADSVCIGTDSKNKIACIKG